MKSVHWYREDCVWVIPTHNQNLSLVKDRLDVRRFCILETEWKGISSKFIMLFIVKYVIGCFPNKMILLVTKDCYVANYVFLLITYDSKNMTIPFIIRKQFVFLKTAANSETDCWPFNYAHVMTDISHLLDIIINVFMYF